MSLTFVLQVGDSVGQDGGDDGLPVLLSDAVKQTGVSLTEPPHTRMCCVTLRNSLLQTDAELLRGQGGSRRGGLHRGRGSAFLSGS